MAVLTYTDAWIADPSDANFPLAPTTKLVNLTALEGGASTGFGLRGEPDFDADTQETVELGSFLADGNLQAGSRHGNAEITMLLRYEGSTIGGMLDALRDLSAALDSYGVLAWQILGTEDPLYFDYSPSPLAKMLRGQDRGLFKAAKLLKDTGLPITFRAFPFPRSAPVVHDSVTLNNSITASVPNRDILVNNPGDRRGELKLLLTPVSTAVVGQYRISLRSRGNLDEFRTLYSKPSADTTLKNSTAATVVADSIGTGGKAARTAFATVPEMAKRFKDSRVATDPTAIEGTFKCYARIKSTVASDGLFNLQLRYGTSNNETVMETNKVYESDWRDVDTPNFVEVSLGYVTIPDNASRIVLELWAQRISGTAELDIDQLILEPSDEYHAVVASPGFRIGAYGYEKWEPDQLNGTGDLKRGTFRVNANNETADSPPANGIVLPAGTHVFGIEGMVREAEGSASAEVARLQAIKDPGGANTVQKFVTLRNKKNQRWTRQLKEVYFTVSSADEAGSVKWLARLKQTAAPSGSTAVRIRRVWHRFLRSLTSDLPLTIDTYTRHATAGLGTSDQFPMVLENELPYVPSGDCLVIISAGVLPTDPGYTSLDERGVVARSILTTESTCVATVLPRYSN